MYFKHFRCNLTQVPVYIGSIIGEAICPLPYCFRCFRKLTLQKCLILVQKTSFLWDPDSFSKTEDTFSKCSKGPLRSKGQYRASFGRRASQSQWEGSGLFATAPFFCRFSRDTGEWTCSVKTQWVRSKLPSSLFPSSTLNGIQQDQQLVLKGLHGSALHGSCSSLLCSYCPPRGNPALLIFPESHTECDLACRPTCLYFYWNRYRWYKSFYCKSIHRTYGLYLLSN